MHRLSLIFACGLVLAGCASPPLVVRGGSVDVVHGKPVALLASPADSAEASHAGALVVERLRGLGAGPAGASPSYLLQVGFSALPAKVGVTRDMTAPHGPDNWTSAPAKARPLMPGRAGYALTVVGLDAATGLPAFSATATEHRRSTPDAAMQRLVNAAFPPAVGGS